MVRHRSREGTPTSACITCDLSSIPLTVGHDSAQEIGTASCQGAVLLAISD
jgi:hypothetical protein